MVPLYVDNQNDLPRILTVQLNDSGMMYEAQNNCQAPEGNGSGSDTYHTLWTHLHL